MSLAPVAVIIARRPRRYFDAEIAQLCGVHIELYGLEEVAL
jgi:hypothetical protein